MKLYLILAFIGAALADAKFESQCAQKPDPGFCKARLPRWFLNTTTGKCEKFSYSGCGGNQNRFLIKEKCELTCITEMQNHLLLSTFGEKKARKPGGHLNRAVDEVSKVGMKEERKSLRRIRMQQAAIHRSLQGACPSFLLRLKKQVLPPVHLRRVR
ncbi:uncharacterized protein LOC144134672 isoform X3 [Amblyomma americanum]